jgi:hypothetical protein
VRVQLPAGTQIRWHFNPGHQLWLVSPRHPVRDLLLEDDRPESRVAIEPEFLGPNRDRRELDPAERRLQKRQHVPDLHHRRLQTLTPASDLHLLIGQPILLVARHGSHSPFVFAITKARGDFLACRTFLALVNRARQLATAPEERPIPFATALAVSGPSSFRLFR